MYEEFYGLNEKPFTLQPDPSFLFMGERHKIAYTMLEYGVTNESPITVITGEIGSGKTTLVRHLLNQLDDDDYTIGLITNTHLNFGDLMTWISMAYGLDYKDKDKVEKYQEFIDFIIDNYAQGKKVLLIVDEAQNMDPETLEELRVISNINVDKDQLIQIILVGQPELRDVLREPFLEQLAQRVSVDYHLSPFDPPETDEYISYRLSKAGGSPDIFEADARRFIHYYTDGVPRLINNIAEISLVYGFATQKKTIDARVVYNYILDKIQNGGGLLVKRKRRYKLADVYPNAQALHVLDIHD